MVDDDLDMVIALSKKYSVDSHVVVKRYLDLYSYTCESYPKLSVDELRSKMLVRIEDFCKNYKGDGR